MNGWMDGWMDEWMMDGWMDGWMSERNLCLFTLVLQLSESLKGVMWIRRQ